MPKQPSMLVGAFHKPFPQQVAFFRNKLRRLVPTQRWDDMQGAEHDTGFMVAGAQKADLLMDLYAAVSRAIAEGKSIQAFRKDFFSIVQKHGWHGWTGEGTATGQAWRTRVIYQTNMRTSYAAGRRAQLVAAGFPIWVYKHGRSREPRPHHLALDGLALPADHPFWEYNYPPADNVFGCRCYVVGARSERGAVRLGADLSKTLPENWEEIFTTGYNLGASVTDTVAVMADKTRQWEYELSKAYMLELPDDLRDRFAESYRNLPSVADDVRNYAYSVLESGGDVPRYRTLGLLTGADVTQIQAAKQLDVAGFDFAMDSSAVHHVERHHGNDKDERQRGQRGVTGDDYAVLPLLLNNGGAWIDKGKSDSTGMPLVGREALIDGERFIAVFEVRRKRKMLALMTYYIRTAQNN